MFNIKEVKMLNMKFVAIPLFFCAASACSQVDYAPLSLTVDGQNFIATGVIDGSTPDVITNAIASNPEIRTLVLQNVPGSIDDEANLTAARSVRAAGLTTVVPAGGLVASGGTDLFLAGETRVIGEGACVGVHSWSDGTLQGKDVPRNDPQHQLYLKYYAEMGTDAEFYWYTLEAAPAEGIHWMLIAEMNTYEMSTTTLSGTVEASDASCNAIDE